MQRSIAAKRVDLPTKSGNSLLILRYLECELDLFSFGSQFRLLKSVLSVTKLLSKTGEFTIAGRTSKLVYALQVNLRRLTVLESDCLGGVAKIAISEPRLRAQSSSPEAALRTSWIAEEERYSVAAEY